ncbi:MAG: aminopeptidase [Caldilinea sp.]|uniref:aminopeptidase n=1 Tax=Caldilinea sp. TaxID=2293560 RepID=UPI0030A67759
MSDPRIDGLARLLVNYCVSARPGDWVAIQSDLAAQPLVERIYASLLEAGAHPTVLYRDETLEEVFYRQAGEPQLRWLSPLDALMAERVDARIVVRAPSNTRALTGVDPQAQRLHQQAQKPLLDHYRRRSAEGAHRWVLTNFPCPALAQEADMSLREFEAFVYAATFVDQPDPIAAWQAMHDRQQRLVDWLAGKSEVIVHGPDVDLRLSIAGRTFINSDGKRNMPSGEIFTGPVEESVEGWIRFRYPAIRGGREVEGVEFTFAQGRVASAKAAKNEAYLLSQLDSDPGARYLGEFAIGTNDRIQRFTKNILFDEKIGGTIHIALGAGYPETGSRNDSSIHWDFICDMRRDSEIWVDGELFYKDGRFMIA